MSSYVVVGGSRGIGAAAIEHLVGQGHDVIAVSRTRAPLGTWVEADIGTLDGIDGVLEGIGDRRLDGFLFLGGTWEQGAFTDRYSFLDSSVEETLRVIAVNLTAPILLAQGLARNLASAPNARIILMGSLSGLPNAASAEVANTASKFGLQGAAEALNLSLRHMGISTVVINPGNIATAEVRQDIEDGRFGEQVPIPMADVLKTIDYALALSAASVPASISVHQTNPEG